MNITGDLINAAQANDIATCQNLLTLGANPNDYEDYAQVRPIHIATANNAIESLLLLLATGADPNLMTIDGDTALDIALRFKFMRIANLLQKYPFACYHNTLTHQ